MVPSPASLPAPTTGAPPAALGVTDYLVEQLSRSVLERLSDRVVRETVTDIVSKVAERLVREEIERLKASINER